MSTIKIQHLTFGFDAQEGLLFDQTSLNLDESWKLGLIGRNGRGKTTFLQLLMGKLPHTGSIQHTSNFVYFPQTIQDKQALTHEVLTEISVFEEWKLKREMNGLQLSLELLWQPFETLSGGEQTKILLALLFTDDTRFPLLDEPTNHLDIPSKKQVATYLKNKKQGFIVVSHDRKFIDEVVNHILAIEKNQLLLYQGNFTTYEQEKQNKDTFEAEQNKKIAKEITRLKSSAIEKSNWAISRETDNHGNPTIKGSGGTGHDGFVSAKAKRMMKRSKAISGRIEKQIAEKEQLLKNIEYLEPLAMDFRPSHKERLVSAENLTLSYDEKQLFLPVSFTLKKGERLAIIGANGLGKSSLIQRLFGHFTGKSGGNCHLANSLSISCVRQNYEDNLGTLPDFAKKNKIDYQVFLMNLKKLGMERTVFEQKIEQMSMGQRKKVELAKSLSTPAELYIWDEPLNYLDLFNHKQLEELLHSVKPSMIFVEHDPTFVSRVATKTVLLKQD